MEEAVDLRRNDGIVSLEAPYRVCPGPESPGDIGAEFSIDSISVIEKRTLTVWNALTDLGPIRGGAGQRRVMK
jgi:hypothetical protein